LPFLERSAALRGDDSIPTGDAPACCAILSYTSGKRANGPDFACAPVSACTDYTSASAIAFAVSGETATVNAVHPPSPNDEIVVTAVGDVMLGTTFPDESTLPPNDGADLLTEVTPFLKRGDVVYGNLEGPIVDGGDSAKCRGKR